ncbi:MAG: hypothetical protein HY319_08385 [Armatimonadetes bacterium]|nr:hypothetical protein [Armatimonadota bacterium]
MRTKFFLVLMLLLGVCAAASLAGPNCCGTDPSAQAQTEKAQTGQAECPQMGSQQGAHSCPQHEAGKMDGCAPMSKADCAGKVGCKSDPSGAMGCCPQMGWFSEPRCRRTMAGK